MCAVAMQNEQITKITKYSKNTNLSCLRLAANYSSKEAADEEEPELDPSTVPSLDEHIMKDDVSLPLPGYVARRGAPGPPMATCPHCLCQILLAAQIAKNH